MKNFEVIVFVIVFIGIIIGGAKFVLFFEEDKRSAVQMDQVTILVRKEYIPEETSISVSEDGYPEIDYDPPEYWFHFNNGLKREVTKQEYDSHFEGSRWERTWRQGKFVHNENWRKLEDKEVKGLE